MCGSGCYVLATYASVYVEGSNGFTKFAEVYDGAAQLTAYDPQPGQTLTATTYQMTFTVWLEVCTSWGWGECLASDYWPSFSDGEVTVTPTAVPTADGVWPSSGAGPSQTFTLQYSSAVGAGDLSQGWVWFDATGGRSRTPAWWSTR